MYSMALRNEDSHSVLCSRPSFLFFSFLFQFRNVISHVCQSSEGEKDHVIRKTIEPQPGALSLFLCIKACHNRR